MYTHIRVKMHLMLVLLLDGIASNFNVVIYLFKATIKLNYVVS